MNQNFFQKNKVFILGLLASISLILQEFIGQPEVDLKVIGFAVGMATLAFLAKEWRGQGLSIIGIVGNLAGAFITVHETGNFSWLQFVLTGTVAIIAASAPDPKSRGYEHTETITQAKKQGEKIQPAALTNKPDK